MGDRNELQSKETFIPAKDNIKELSHKNILFFILGIVLQSLVTCRYPYLDISFWRSRTRSSGNIKVFWHYPLQH